MFIVHKRKCAVHSARNGTQGRSIYSSSVLLEGFDEGFVLTVATGEVVVTDGTACVKSMICNNDMQSTHSTFAIDWWITIGILDTPGLYYNIWSFCTCFYFASWLLDTAPDSQATVQYTEQSLTAENPPLPSLSPRCISCRRTLQREDALTPCEWAIEHVGMMCVEKKYIFFWRVLDAALGNGPCVPYQKPPQLEVLLVT